MLKLLAKISGLMFLLLSFARSDESLQIIATIEIERDSTHMSNIAPIGDYNADGHPDIAIMAFQIETYDAVYIYYGGPGFDTEPDLIIESEPQDSNSICEFFDSYFGMDIVGLNDFNGDGYDDFAISAPYYCSGILHEGRVYIFFGSPNPDTTADLIISGEEVWENFGTNMGAGDINGDGIGDILIASPRGEWLATRLSLYYGSEDPDNIRDWVNNFDGHEEIMIYSDGFGFNANGDQYDDFAVVGDFINYYSGALFTGGDPPAQNPELTYEYFISFIPDISGDSIDEFTIYVPDSGWYICLGGDSLNLIPDYYMGQYGGYGFDYALSDTASVLLIRKDLHLLAMFNKGVPFDTIPRNVFDYGQNSVGDYKLNIGDINADGTDDIALAFPGGTYDNGYLNIYSILPVTSVEDDISGYRPLELELLSAYPNPFNSSCKITVTDPNIELVEIFDITGRLVERLDVTSGSAEWEATGLPSGVYFARGENKTHTNTVRLVLLK